MKTLRKQETVRRPDGRTAVVAKYKRVPDLEAAMLVATTAYKYCPKKLWKRDVRDADPAAQIGGGA